MTANPTTATNGQTSGEKSKARRGPSKTKRSAAGRGRSGRSASSRGNNNNSGGAQSSASRFMSQGRQALGDAYGWVSESAGRALPRAARYVPSQDRMRNMLEDRPLIVGAIGLGLGALIGMMLPSHMLGMKSAKGRRSGSRRKS